jgi:hypothetical protein
LRGLIDVPLLPRHKGRGSVEQILPVIQVKNGIVPLWFLVITGRQINQYVAVFVEKTGMKALMNEEGTRQRVLSSILMILVRLGRRLLNH